MLPVVPLEGRVVGEPEIKFPESGNPVIRFRVVSADRKFNQDTGKWQDGETLWVTVTAFGRLAENTMESLVDGDQVVAIGKWSTAEWTDRQGIKRSVPRFVASAIGAGMQFQPRKHSEPTMAKHRPAPAQQAAEQQAGQGQQGAQAGAEHVYGASFSEAAVAGVAVQGGGAAADDPWA